MTTYYDLTKTFLLVIGFDVGFPVYPAFYLIVLDLICPIFCVNFLLLLFAHNAN